MTVMIYLYLYTFKLKEKYYKNHLYHNLCFNSVAQAYLNQKKLDAEAKQLHQSAIVFSKQTSQWLSLIDNFNSALKELGDVENWTRTIENDMRNITTTLEYAYKGNLQVLI